MKSITTAFFLLLISSFANGGEWHSAGNAPVMPHVPTGIASYKCTLIGYTEVGSKQYRFSQDRVIEDVEFRGQMPVVRMALENTGDPGMDGQSITLSFGAGVDGQEVLRLGVFATIKNKGYASTNFEVLRSAKEISGAQIFSIEKPARGGAKWVRVHAVCRDLN